MFILRNDLPNCVEIGRIKLYADDISSSTGIKDVNDIQAKVIPDMIKICDWHKANKLGLIALETDLMLSRTAINISALCSLLAIRIDGNLIRRVYKS